ncbi:MAG: alpha-galactosidase, partial [Bacteroidota bacterium]|nr:alpha-galactosidase [Bacteroidota bacterium]
MKIIWVCFLLCCAENIAAQTPLQQKQDALPFYPSVENPAAKGDWLLGNTHATTQIYKSANGKDLIISNGLISRQFRMQPYMACFGFSNLVTGKEMLRAIEPEAVITINNKSYRVGGAQGQFERGYVQYDWLDRFTTDDQAFQLVDFSIRDIQSRFPWKPVRWSTQKSWPPKGKEIDFTFRMPGNELQGVTAEVCYEMYDNIPLLSKWLIVHNRSHEAIRIDGFESEKLAMVEESSGVNSDGYFPAPHICIESDYAFGGGTAADANHTTFWLPDTSYTSQVNYTLQSRCLLESKPPVGPDALVSSGEDFESFHTYELMYDGYDRERCGLAERKMYRQIAPWVTENPIFLHLTTTDPEKVKSAID